jgi:hypothetical protein
MFAEEWKDIYDYENYEVSNLGNVRNKKTGRILKSYDKGGYSVVGLSNKKTKTFQLHRLVCQAFVPNPENKPQVNHIDKNGLNNNVMNLEWNSHQENCIHRSNGVTQTTNQNMIIYRIDKNTNEKLEKYDSIELAGEWAFKQGLVKNIHSGRTNISNMIRGVYKISSGFKWILEEQESFENEIWKQVIIKDKDTTNYYVSSLGRFKNSKGIIMKDYKPHHSGYIYVRVNKDKYALHRLIAFTFLENLENKAFVNHIDGNKTNNSLVNIEWNTPNENSLHSHKIRLNKGNKRKIVQYDLEMNKIQDFNSIIEASKTLSMSQSNIKAVLYNKQKTAGGFIFKYLEQSN